MGWELEARLAKRGVRWTDIDGLMRLAEKNGDSKTVAKLEGIKGRMARCGAENAAGCRSKVASVKSGKRDAVSATLPRPIAK